MYCTSFKVLVLEKDFKLVPGLTFSRNLPVSNWCLLSLFSFSVVLSLVISKYPCLFVSYRSYESVSWTLWVVMFLISHLFALSLSQISLARYSSCLAARSASTCAKLLLSIINCSSDLQLCLHKSTYAFKLMGTWTHSHNTDKVKYTCWTGHFSKSYPTPSWDFGTLLCKYGPNLYQCCYLALIDPTTIPAYTRGIWF